MQLIIQTTSIVSFLVAGFDPLIPVESKINVVEERCVPVFKEMYNEIIKKEQHNDIQQYESKELVNISS